MLTLGDQRPFSYLLSTKWLCNTPKQTNLVFLKQFKNVVSDTTARWDSLETLLQFVIFFRNIQTFLFLLEITCPEVETKTALSQYLLALNDVLKGSWFQIFKVAFAKNIGTTYSQSCMDYYFTIHFKLAFKYCISLQFSSD